MSMHKNQSNSNVDQRDSSILKLWLIFTQRNFEKQDFKFGTSLGVWKFVMQLHKYFWLQFVEYLCSVMMRTMVVLLLPPASSYVSWPLITDLQKRSRERWKGFSCERVASQKEPFTLQSHRRSLVWPHFWSWV